MLLPISKIKHLNSVNHEGKIVIIVTDKDGQLYYTVRQEGHEDNFDKTTLKGWEDWEVLPIPHQPVDQSVMAHEAKEWSDTRNGAIKPIIRSVYQTSNTTATAPVQLISGIGHLYIYRQQKSGKLAVDRFVLDGMSNKLVPKLQVRYKRSRQKYEPLRKDATGKEVMDSYDFRDANNIPFLEPSTELSYLPVTKEGWFSVVLLPTKDADQFRWHIFIYNAAEKQLELWSIASSQNGLFEIRDQDGKNGIVKRILNLEEGVDISQAPVATKYDVQFERMTEAGPQLLRDKIRVMLVAPTTKDGMALAINFSADPTGFLSEFGEAADSQILNSYTRQLLLPISSLDEIKSFGQDKEAGTIEAINKGDEGEVWIETDPESLPEVGDQVEISGTKNFNGLHQVLNATKNTIVIEEVVNNIGDEQYKLGKWEQKLDPDESLLFDGMVTAFRKMSGNTIRITSPEHGLKKGDQLQLIGTTDIDGVFGVQDVQNDSFSLDLKWNNSQIINIQSKPRRGIHFDADGDAVYTPLLPLSNPTLGNDLARTVSVWVNPEDLSSGNQLIAGNDFGLLQVLLIGGIVHASMNIKQRGSDQQETILLADEAKMKMEWTHYATSFDYDKVTDITKLILLRDGTVVAQKEVEGKPSAIRNTALLFDGSSNAMLYADTTDLIDFSQSDFTMECWVKTEKGGPVISKFSRQNDQEVFDIKSLIVDESGVVTFTFRGDVIVTSDSKVNDNQWHHLAVTASHRQNSVSLYVDGNVENTVYGVLSMKWKAPAPLSQTNVRGQVTEENGMPVARAVVVVKGTNRGVLTDIDGNFMLAAGKGDILIISYSGYNTLEIPVGRHYTINVQLHNISESNENLLVGAITWGPHHDKRFNGAIDEVRIWKKSKTSHEINAQKNLRLLGTELNLLAYWSFSQRPTMSIIREERKRLFSFASKTANSIELHTENSFSLTNTPPIQVAKWEEQYWFGGTHPASDQYRNFRGKLSSIQIWDKALSAKIVRDSMHLELRGTEDALAVYYPMGGIIENEVIDFSINKLHGTVYGDPYYSERTLNGSILGEQPVTMYQNDELIAISQGAKYHERFEFRLLDENGNPVDPQDIAGKPAFEFYLWGKSSRSADEKIDEGFTNVVQTFNPLRKSDGWHEANCWFNTPDTIRLIRLFAIRDVQGAREVWQHMEVRKHSLKFIADAITLATQVDTLPQLKALADPGVDLGDLPRLEQLQRRYLKEKNRLEARLEKIKTFSNDENEIASRIESLKGNNGLIAKTDKELKEAYNNPLHYYCKIYVQEHQKLFILPPVESTGELQLYQEELPKGTFLDSTMTVGTDAKMKWWEIKKYVGNRCLIFPFSSPSNTPIPNILWHNEVDTYRWDLSFGTEFIEPSNQTTNSLTAYIFDLGDAYLYKKGNRLARDTTNKTRWTIERVNPVTLSPSGKVYIENLKAKVKAYEEELITLEQRLEWQGLLDQLIQKIEPLEVQINQLISQFNSNVTDQQNPEEMPLIANVNDLPTRAAYLSFVKAASRLNIMESCEGNLILSYFDIQGRMRQTFFDATADSRNSTFEQWLPETMKSCLDFSHNDNSVVTLNSPIALGENWTIEFWFSYPLPNTPKNGAEQVNKDHIFISGIGQKEGQATLSSPTMIKQTERDGLEIQELGILTSEQIDHLDSEPFLGTGFNMESLPHGWHHMTVQGTGIGANSTVSFFINGKKVGDDIRTQYLINHPDIEEKKLKQFQFNYTDQISGFGNLILRDQMTNPFAWKRDFKVGRMAEVRFWDILLSPEEIEMNSRSYLSGNEPGLVAYYPLSEGANDVARNYAANYSLEQDTNASIKNARWVPSTVPIGHPGDQAVFFDGEKDVIEFEQPVQLKESCSLSLWFKSSNEGRTFFGAYIPRFNLFNFDNLNSRNTEKDAVRNSLSVMMLDNVLIVSYVKYLYKKDSDGLYTINDVQNRQTESFSYKLGSAIDSSWHHINFSIDKGTFQLIYDGKEILPNASPGEPIERKKIDGWATVTLPLKVGVGFLGQLADFQIWDRALTTEEIQKIRFRRQLGSEPGLSLYCPLDKVTEDKRVINFSSDNYGKTHQTDTHLMEATFTNDLPIGLDAAVVAEYPTVAFDPETNQQTAMMWRFLAVPKVDKLHLLTHKRIELLEQVWVGNGQFDPTLLGFIEGAPPVPSENLTVEDDYSDATSIMLSVGKNTEYSWERTQDIFTELDMSAKIGGDVETHIGGGLFGIALVKMQVKGLAGIAANFRYGAQNASTISSSSSLNLNDSLSLRGYKEEKAAFENIGSRFLPKNIGYALVVSSMADIFIIRLKRSKKMVTYKVLPLEGIPPQVNTITFMINPAYSLNGSLDGQVGTNAADDRFYRQVPEMRSQFGTKYPASYLKLEQAIFLQSAIDEMDKERESYFQNFNSRLVDEMALDREINDDSSAPKKINVKDASGEVVVDEDEFNEAGDEAEEKTKKMQEEAGQSLDKYQVMAESGSKAAGLYAWQTKMEKLLLKAGKQNIVNSYVWDADGGLHASSESFASTITHSIGGSFSFVGSLGMELEIAMGFAAELGIAAGVGVELTMSKSESTSQEIGLEVDMSGMEHRGITDDKDYPLVPGEKVDRYRFSSFFLEGNTSHFHDFFNEVVDPEWLMSNDEEARALRTIDTSKANKAWRILHRVTYVERPALMGFGRDTRPLLGNEVSNDMAEQIEKIGGNLKDVERNTDQLKRKIAHLEDALELAKGQNEQMAGQLEQIIQMLTQK